MCAVYTVLIGVDIEVPPISVDGIECRATVRVKAQIGLTVVILSAAGAGSGVRVGINGTSRCLPYQGKGRESALVHMELQAIASVFSRHHGNRAVLDVLDIKAGLSAVPVQILEVQQCKICTCVCPLWISPVDVHTSLGADPGISVVGIHQIQVLDLIAACAFRMPQDLIRLILQRRQPVYAVGRDDAVKQQRGRGSRSGEHDICIV